MANTALDFYVTISAKYMTSVYDENNGKLLGYRFSKEYHVVNENSLMLLMNLEKELNFWLNNYDSIPYDRIQLWGTYHMLFYSQFEGSYECRPTLILLLNECTELLKQLTNLVSDFRGEPRCDFRFIS